MDQAMILNVFLMLGVTIATIVVLAYILKSLKHFNLPIQGECIKVKAGVSLGGRAKVFLLEVDNKQIIVGATEQQINTLHVMDVKESRSACE